MDTYKFKLPENKEVKGYFVKVKDGELIVDVEMKNKFEPKDGDFLVTKLGSIFIYNPNYESKYAPFYIGISFEGHLYAHKDGDSIGFSALKDCRYVTEEEKEAFLEKLEKEHHKRWNPEKKCLEDIYVPKFGDIVKIDHSDCTLYERNYIIAIVPNKDIPDCKYNGFFDIAFLDMEGGLRLNGTSSYIPDNVYLASEDEKKDLFDKLAEVGKRWNPETKELEDIRWKPKPGEHFWYITTSGDIAFTRYIKGYPLDEQLISINNCFKTEQIANREAEKFKEFLKNSKAV